MNGAGRRRRLPGSAGSSRRRYGWETSRSPARRILLHAEQGFGDTIQFIRYALLLAGSGSEGDL